MYTTGEFGRGHVYGNYTNDHFIYNKNSHTIQQHGSQSLEPTEEDKYEIFTTCPLGVDESGTMFTPIDSDFCGRELKNMAWKEYTLLYKAILRVVKQTGGYWFHGKSYTDVNKLHEFSAPVCRHMLECMKDPLDSQSCQDFELYAELFIENVLTESMRVRTYERFGMTSEGRKLVDVDGGVASSDMSVVSAVITGGKSSIKLA